MIKHLCIRLQSADGKLLYSKDIIVNRHLLLKGPATVWELMSNFIKHLACAPQDYTVEVSVSAEEEDIKSFIALQEGNEFYESAFDAMCKLTQREIQTLDLLDEGKNEKEIARQYGIGHASVRNLCCRIYRKFHCNSKGEAIAAYRRLYKQH